MTMDTAILQGLATSLRDAARERRPIAPVREALARMGVAGAYAVQDINTAYYLDAGRRLTGRKIGLTSKSVQLQLGVDAPDFGMLFADMELAPDEEVALGRVLQPKVEAEVAVVLERDLKHEQVTLSQLMSAIGYVLPAVEIVGSRIRDWDIRLLDTVADNASSGLYALGTQPKKLSEVDLRTCGMLMERKGEVVSLGVGAACLGHPLNAALWLARKMAEVGRPLHAGDVIMTGALGPMVTVAPGDVIDTTIAGLGVVRTAFASD
ncbi:2-oxopent-4-enoate hydratase [Cupriavidus yeoncheonensis]|uniref:2-oxopent-4-enoate hydratase n=1 Tax=Cupriavidus yeoncheonensis TaxID=1462994 RepID=A0A916J0Z8_9BURK|nr:2-keto-4-pentenoate hydratase [Cupriavidus yeoncheonensis]CAG2153506.1 2-oxopent-4-enoate hydratase [Cupriavidus yeoncheonensis]